MIGRAWLRSAMVNFTASVKRFRRSPQTHWRRRPWHRRCYTPRRRSGPAPERNVARQVPTIPRADVAPGAGGEAPDAVVPNAPITSSRISRLSAPGEPMVYPLPGARDTAGSAPRSRPRSVRPPGIARWSLRAGRVTLAERHRAGGVAARGDVHGEGCGWCKAGKNRKNGIRPSQGWWGTRST